MKLCSSHAFSLLEILVALTLFAVVMMVTLDLWPAAQRLTRVAEENKATTLIAQRIAETLRVTFPNGIVATAPDWRSNPSHCIILRPTDHSAHYVAYDAKGEPYRELSAIEHQSALREKNVVSLAQIVITNNPFPGLTNISIIMATPACLPEKQRHHTEFVFLLSTEPETEGKEAHKDALSTAKYNSEYNISFS